MDILNAPTGTELVRVIAVDKDAGDNGRVAYTIHSDKEQGYFFIDGESGIVSLATPILRTTKVEVMAHDFGSPMRRTSLELTFMTAMDQTVEAMRLLLSNPVVKISEKLRIGSDVLNVAGPVTLNKGFYK